jgi:hypothetical protein
MRLALASFLLCVAALACTGALELFIHAGRTVAAWSARAQVHRVDPYR